MGSHRGSYRRKAGSLDPLDFEPEWTGESIVAGRPCYPRAVVQLRGEVGSPFWILGQCRRALYLEGVEDRTIANFILGAGEHVEDMSATIRYCAKWVTLR